MREPEWWCPAPWWSDMATATIPLDTAAEFLRDAAPDNYDKQTLRRAMLTGRIRAATRNIEDSTVLLGLRRAEQALFADLYPSSMIGLAGPLLFDRLLKELADGYMLAGRFVDRDRGCAVHIAGLDVWPASTEIGPGVGAVAAFCVPPPIGPGLIADPLDMVYWAHTVMAVTVK